MPRTAPRGGPETRARIARNAAILFLERGFDAVTVADVATAAGVSSVTVFKHFPRKEDLFLDRQDDAAALLRATIRDRAAGADATAALQEAALGLLTRRQPLSGLAHDSTGFFRTVAGSPALIARAREIAAELQAVLAEELAADASFRGDPELYAAFFVAGYASVLVATARGLLAGDSAGELARAHRRRLDALFAALRDGVAG